MLILVALLALAFAPPAETGTAYYLDCADGADSSAGTSPGAAWRTLTRVSATPFEPGDSILLRRGTHCAGQLRPKGSGQPGRPILIGAYGDGPLPVIDGAGHPAAIQLVDQSHWVVELLEAKGGSPYGVFVSGTRGEVRDVVLRSLVVHDVTGEPASKTSGLVVVSAGTDSVRMSDLLIDGITAFNTTQWAGIEVNGYGASGANRIRNVTVRNSLVHHVAGDGIILFSVEDGVIERSAAWLTGLQPVQTIGTPNGIWTWTCRRCAVRQTEGFFTDSPGVDGGVYDIDFGNDDNVVEDNYGHDAMGYCVAVFGAERLVTANSAVRRNLCVDNGRSPKLARRQGDLFVYTWNGGSLDGVRIEDNTFYWNPVLDAPAAVLAQAQFTGTRPNVMAGNRFFTGVSQPLEPNAGITFERNVISPAPEPAPAGAGRPARLRIELALGDSGDARAQLVFLQTALAAYPERLEVTLVTPTTLPRLAYDWNLGCVRLTTRRARPGLRLVTAERKELARWSGFVPPAELGMALRRYLGTPRPLGTASGVCGAGTRS